MNRDSIRRLAAPALGLALSLGLTSCGGDSQSPTAIIPPPDVTGPYFLSWTLQVLRKSDGFQKQFQCYGQMTLGQSAAASSTSTLSGFATVNSGCAPESYDLNGSVRSGGAIEFNTNGPKPPEGPCPGGKNVHFSGRSRPPALPSSSPRGESRRSPARSSGSTSSRTWSRPRSEEAAAWVSGVRSRGQGRLTRSVSAVSAVCAVTVVRVTRPFHSLKRDASPSPFAQVRVVCTRRAVVPGRKRGGYDRRRLVGREADLARHPWRGHDDENGGDRPDRHVAPGAVLRVQVDRHRERRSRSCRSGTRAPASRSARRGRRRPRRTASSRPRPPRGRCPPRPRRRHRRSGPSGRRGPSSTPASPPAGSAARAAASRSRRASSKAAITFGEKRSGVRRRDGSCASASRKRARAASLWSRARWAMPR